MLAALEPLSRGEDWDFERVRLGLRSASAAVRHAVAGDPRGALAQQEWLERAYGFLAACTDGEYDRTREFVLGRIASLLDLAAAAAPPMSDAELDALLDVRLEEGQTKLEFLRRIATGPQRPTDMADLVPHRENSSDRGMSAASKHLKHLMLAGYLLRERSGREVRYRLSAAGHEALLKHPPRGWKVETPQDAAADSTPVISVVAKLEGLRKKVVKQHPAVARTGTGG